jgi:predicted RNA-binding Zn-ribbon protein involved in translation (DUF1610 family)
MRFDGMSVTFPEQVNKIISHRLLNPKQYPTTEPQFLDFDSVAHELDLYTCTRLGNHPTYCTDGSKNGISAAAAPRYIVQTCPKCQSAMIEKYCATCSGKKVVGYKCTSCGFERDR